MEKDRSHGDALDFTTEPLKGKSGSGDPGCRCVCECAPVHFHTSLAVASGIHEPEPRATPPEPERPDRSFDVNIGGDPVPAAAIGDRNAFDRTFGILPPPGGSLVDPPEPTQAPGPFGSDPWSGTSFQPRERQAGPWSRA